MVSTCHRCQSQRSIPCFMISMMVLAKSACNQRRHVACQDSSSPVYQVKQSDHAPTKSRSQSSREPRGRASYSAGWPKPSEWHHYSSQISRSTGNRDSPHRMRQNKKKPRSSSEPVPPPSFKWVYMSHTLGRHKDHCVFTCGNIFMVVI